MADNKVQIMVEVMTSGADSLDKVDSKMTDLAKSTDKSAVSTQKSNTGMTLSNTLMTKQIPLLKDLAPLTNMLGMGSILASAGITAMAVGLMKAGQTMIDLQSSVMMLGVSINDQTTGPMQTYATMMATVTDLSNKWNVPIKDIIKAMGDMNIAITDPTTRMNILDEAMIIHNKTGEALPAIVKSLSDALAGTKPVLDDTNSSYLQGNDALKQQEKNMLSMGTPITSFQSGLKDLSGKSLQDLLTVLGTLGTILLDVFYVAMAQIDGVILKPLIGTFKAVGDIIGTVIDFFKDVGKDPIDALKKLAQGILDFMITPVNLAIDAINSLITLIDKIPGVNIPKIPELNSKVAALDVPGQAEGGITQQSGLSLIGENGPELLNLPSGAVVSPLNSGGGQSQPTTINLYLSDGTPLATWVMEHIKDKANLQGAY